MFREAVEYAGGWAEDVIVRAYHIEDLREVKTSYAIYLCEDVDGTLDYIGSAWRPSARSGGLRAEVRRHLSDCTRTWRRVWVIPLNPAVSKKATWAIEGRLIARFRPPGNCCDHQDLYVPPWQSAAVGK